MLSARQSSVLAALCTLPLVAACEGGSDTPTTPTTAITDAAVTSSPDTAVATDSAAVTSAAPAALRLELPEVACEGAAREPSALESSLLVEAGPLSGDAFDGAEVVSAARAMDPQTPEDWHTAILQQVHGDYADEVCANLAFSGDIGEGSAGPTEAAAPSEAVGRNHFAVVLDASGSMAESSGGQTRMEAAKEAISSFAGNLPAGSTLSLRVYGHEGSNGADGKEESCASTEVVFEGNADDAGLQTSLEEVQPVGWTPLAMGIEKAAADIPQDSSDSIVYVVTDGLETCGGDPVQAAGNLASSGVEPVINVIGFQVGNTDQEALREIADAGGGEYTSVDSGAALEEYWSAEYDRMRQAWAQWKDTELARIREEGSQNREENDAIAQALKDTTAQEREHARTAVELVEQEGLIGYDERIALFDLISARDSQIGSYASDQLFGNYDDLRATWQEYEKATEELGLTKWTEYYEKAQNS